jgi:hypothetical protein
MQNKYFWNSQVVLYNHVQPRSCHPNLGCKPFYVESQVVLYNQGKPAPPIPPALLHPVLFGVRLVRFPVLPLIIGVVISPGLAAVRALLAIRGISGDSAAVVIASPATLAGGRKTHGLLGMKRRRLEWLTAIGADGIPGYHRVLRAWIGPVILGQELSHKK